MSIVAIDSRSTENQDFRDAMACVPDAVFVLATDGNHGKGGLTITSFTSVSIEPPTVSVCINNTNKQLDRILNNGVFSINMLFEPQNDIANAFAGVGSMCPEDRFSVGSWDSLETGSPVLQSSAMSLDCQIIARQLIATHCVIFGKVVETGLLPKMGSSGILMYHQRSYSAH